MPENFQLVERCLGYFSKIDKTNAPPEILVSPSQNIIINDGEKVQTRGGFSIFGAVGSGSDPIESSYDWQTSSNTTLSLRSYSDELEVYVGTVEGIVFNAWERVLNGWTAVDFSFAPWWYATDLFDELLFVNGSDKIEEWTGAMTTFASYGTNTLTKQITTHATWANARFMTTGTTLLRIKDTGGVWREFTYTGGEGTAILTGVTPDPATAGFTFAAGALIMQSVRENDNKPVDAATNDFIWVDKNQLHIGSISRNQIYVSKDTSFIDFTFTSGRLPGEGALLILDSVGRGFMPLQGHMLISAGRDDWYYTNYEQITVGTVLCETLKVIKLKTSPGMAAQSQDLISGEYFLSFENVLRKIISIDDNNNLITEDLSDPIKPDMDAANFANGHLKRHQSRTYIACPTDSILFILEKKQITDRNGNIGFREFWQTPQILPIRRLAIISDLIYGHSSGFNETYKLFTGTSDRQYTIAGTATNTAATSPGTMADDASIGTQQWANVNNAKVSDNVYVAGDNAVMHYLKATNFGFAIPSGVTIDGILVEIEEGSWSGSPKENSIKIVKGGVISGNEKSTGATLPVSDAYVSYGSSSDLWGLSWTAEDINLSTFGVVISVNALLAGSSVDHIRITVYYTTATEDGASPIAFNATYSYRNYGEADKLKKFTKWLIEGYIRGNTKITHQLRYDFQGATQTLEKIIDGADEDLLYEIVGGMTPLGTTPLGLQEESTQQPKFRKINTFAPRNFFEIQSVFYSSAIDDQFEILRQGGNVLLSGVKPSKITK